MQDSEDTPDVEATESLGSRLRNAREALDLSIDTIASELRIGPHLLAALEDGRFDLLDAPVFAKGYLKQYGSRLGLDVAELVAEFDRTVHQKAVEIAPSRAIRLRDERQITVWIVALIVLLLIGGMLGAWWWFGQESLMNLFSSSGGASLAGRAPAAVVVSVGDSVLPAAEPETEPEPELALEIAEAAEAGSAAADDGPEIVSSASPVVATESLPESASVLDVTADAESAPEPEPVPAYAGPEIEIRFVADSWAEVVDEAGRRWFYNLGRAGSVARVPADRPLNLFFGFADGVELSFEGEPIAIPASARRDELAQFNLDLTARLSAE